jgi:hypothetical protein
MAGNVDQPAIPTRWQYEKAVQRMEEEHHPGLVTVRLVFGEVFDLLGLNEYLEGARLFGRFAGLKRGRPKTKHELVEMCKKVVLVSGRRLRRGMQPVY